MRATFAPVSATHRETGIQTQAGLEFEWTITFRADGEGGLSFVTPVVVRATSEVEARSKALSRMRTFLTAIAEAAHDFQL
jgi:hypothetical protein